MHLGNIQQTQQYDTVVNNQGLEKRTSPKESVLKFGGLAVQICARGGSLF